MATVNVTTGMPMEMLETVDDQADDLGLSRARFIRKCIREHPLTKLDEPDETIEMIAGDGEASPA